MNKDLCFTCQEVEHSHFDLESGRAYCTLCRDLKRSQEGYVQISDGVWQKQVQWEIV